MPLPVSEAENKTPKSFFSLQRTHVLQNSTHHIVPPLFSGDLRVIPECTYMIQVIAGPNDEKHHPHFNYTVPGNEIFYSFII